MRADEGDEISGEGDEISGVGGEEFDQISEVGGFSLKPLSGFLAQTALQAW